MTRALDKVKSKVFLGDNSAFLGSLMCSMQFVWNEHIETAQTDGITIEWNPNWFLSLPEPTRVTVLKHELWHVARMHMLRSDKKDPKIFNYACDIRINNDLLKEGSSFDGTNPMIAPELDDNGVLAEEQIYELLMKDKSKVPQNGAGGTWGTGEDDLKADDPTAAKQSATIVGNVVRAVQQAELANKESASTDIGKIKEILNKFLNPIVPWERLLMEYFTELDEPELSWKRPNRRYPDIYMPSNVEAHNGLEDLRYYLDVSGSISKADIIRFNSELKYVLEVLKPKKLTIVQFDYVIQQEDVFTSDIRFDGLNVHGRGGTCLRCVREDIIKHNPTAAVIFSDLDVHPMKKLPKDIPVIWVAVDSNRLVQPYFGKLIKIPKE